MMNVQQSKGTYASCKYMFFSFPKKKNTLKILRFYDDDLLQRLLIFIYGNVCNHIPKNNKGFEETTLNDIKKIPH